MPPIIPILKVAAVAALWGLSYGAACVAGMAIASHSIDKLKTWRQRRKGE